MDRIGVFFIGCVSGWLVNYLADILPVSTQLTPPVCSQCNKTVPWGAYFLFRACSNCGKKRSWRSWLVQITAPFVAIFLYQFPPARLGFWIGFALLAYFALVTVIDLEYRIILRLLYALGLVVGLGIGWMIRGPLETLLGGLAGFAMMLMLYYFGIVFNHLLSRIRKEKVDEVALGLGDVYVMAGLGLMMGWPEVVGGLLLALILGGLVSGGIALAGLMKSRYQPLQAIPYSPFLLLAAVIMIYLPKQ